MAEAVREAENLDFKEALYADTDATKDELAADIASFANHRGGSFCLVSPKRTARRVGSQESRSAMGRSGA